MHRNREIVVVQVVEVVGSHGQLTQSTILRNPRTKYKRSKSVFPVTFIALSCARLCTRLLQPLAQSQIGSPGTLPGNTKVDTRPFVADHSAISPFLGGLKPHFLHRRSLMGPHKGPLLHLTTTFLVTVSLRRTMPPFTIGMRV